MAKCLTCGHEHPKQWPHSISFPPGTVFPGDGSAIVPGKPAGDTGRHVDPLAKPASTVINIERHMPVHQDDDGGFVVPHPLVKALTHVLDHPGSLIYNPVTREFE